MKEEEATHRCEFSRSANTNRATSFFVRCLHCGQESDVLKKNLTIRGVWPVARLTCCSRTNIYHEPIL
jgi:hypothetical protein